MFDDIQEKGDYDENAVCGGSSERMIHMLISGSDTDCPILLLKATDSPYRDSTVERAVAHPVCVCVRACVCACACVWCTHSPFSGARTEVRGPAPDSISVLTQSE